MQPDSPFRRHWLPHWHAAGTGEFMSSLIRIALLAVCLTGLLAVPFVATQENRSNDLFVVIVNNKRGFIDRSGKIVIKPKWDGANNFSEGRAVVVFNSPRYKEGYIDITGKLVIPAIFDSASDFKDGLALAGVGEFGLHGSGDHKFGFIDLNGEWVIKPAYIGLYDFFNGLAAAENDNGKWGFIDNTGKVVIPFQFETGSMFSEGLAPVFSKDKYGYIDKSGKWAIQPQFTQANGFVDGLAVVKRGGVLVKPYGPTFTLKEDFVGQFAIIDRTGKSVIEFEKDVLSVHGFSEGLAAVEVKKGPGSRLTGFIDKSGRFVIEPKYPDVNSFSDGLAQFWLNGKCAFMDKTGKVVFSTDYGADGFKRGLAFIEKVGKEGSFDTDNDKYGYIDKTGKVIWEPTK
jgi:hypothetical protein